MISSSILIVDDLPNWRRQLSNILSQEGYSVEAVAGKKEAEQALMSNRFKLAVIDVRLEDWDEKNVEGLELVEAVDLAGLDIKVIVMTGYVAVTAEQRARRSPRLLEVIEKDKFDVGYFVAIVKSAMTVIS